MEIKSNVVAKRDILEEKNNERLKLFLPNNWWNSTSSFSGFSNETHKKIKLLKFSNRLQDNFKKKKSSFPKSPNWDIAKGDYHVKEILHNNKNKDFLYYRELRKKLHKYSLFAILLFTFAIVYFVLTIFVKI